VRIEQFRTLATYQNRLARNRLTVNVDTCQRLGMEQRSPNATVKKIHPYVPVKLVDDSEAKYREVVASGKETTPTKVQALWTKLGWLVACAPNERAAAKIVRDFRAGKPLSLPVVTPWALRRKRPP
jgi:hypothetical protein